MREANGFEPPPSMVASSPSAGLHSTLSQCQSSGFAWGLVASQAACPAALLRVAAQRGLEGLVSKRCHTPYRSGERLAQGQNGCLARRQSRTLASLQAAPDQWAEVPPKADGFAAAPKMSVVCHGTTDRLRGKGYPFKYVAVAVMRKLVVILNAVLRDGQPWKGAQAACA